MVLLHGAATWGCYMVLLHGAATWCCYKVVMRLPRVQEYSACYLPVPISLRSSITYMKNTKAPRDECQGDIVYCVTGT